MIKYSIFRFFLLVLFTSSFLHQLQAQKIPLYFESYTTENGLPQNLVGKIVQDKTGFIWLTTRDGLSRFDGYNFVNFKHEITDTNSLPADFLTDIVVGPDNGLWIATLGKGLAYYDQEQDMFFRFNDNNNSSAGSLKEILSLYIDKSNHLWIGSNEGLYCSKMDISLFFKDPASFNDKFFEYKPSGEKQKMLCIYEDIEKNVWAGSDEGLFSINKNNNSYKQVVSNKQKNRVNDIAEFDQEFLLIATDNGLFKYSKRTKKSENILETEVFADFNPNLKIDKVLPDKEGNFWIGTYGSGLLYYNPTEAIVYQHTNDMNDEHCIRGDLVSELYIDDSNTLFAGVRTKGLNVAKIRKNYFRRFRYKEDKNSISNNIIYDMLTISNEEVWICTHNGFNKFNPLNGKFKPFYITNGNQIGASAFLMIAKRDSNRFFLSSLEYGLVSFDINTGTFEKFVLERSVNMNVNYITGFYEKNDTTLWLSYYGKGIIEYHKNGKKIREISGLSNNYIKSLYKDTQGRLWVCSWGGGLYLYKPEDDSFKVFTKKEGLNSDYLYCIHEDSDGYLCLGTSSGLTKFDPETYHAVPLKLHKKSIDEEIYSIHEDDKDNLWVGTNNGLFKISKQTGNFINFNVHDGLQSNEFNQRAYAKTNSGHMLFGGINGFNYFHPDSVTQSNFKPQMIITAFSLFYKNYKKGDKYNDRILLKKTIEYTDTITLKHNENVIEFNFSALDFYESFEIKYAYRLLGFEENWVNTSAKKRFASYTNLKPGNYDFQLKSTNSDGVWNDNIKQVHIVIEPAFWQTIWFRLFILLVVFIVIYLFIKIRIRRAIIQQKRLKRLIKLKTKSISDKNNELEEQTEELNQLTELLKSSNKSLEKKVRKRTKKLKKALDGSKEAEKLISSFLSNLSHEIRTPMNAINGFSQLITDHNLTDEQRVKYGDIINKNVDLLLALIDNIMNISKLHTGRYVVKKSTFSLNKLFDELYTEFKSRVQIVEKNIDFGLKISLKNQNVTLFSDRDILKQIIFQLVDNALKYTEKGTINFGFEIKQPEMELQMPKILKTITNQNKKELINPPFELTLVVQDTGVGIDKKQQKYIFNAFKKVEGKKKIFRGTGLGLALVKNLADKLFGEIKLESQIGVGTKVIISIPLSME